MKHNIKRELATHFVPYVAENYPTTRISTEAMALILNELYAKLLELGKVPRDYGADFTVRCKGRLNKVNSFLNTDYRNLIIQDILQYSEQSKVENLRKWFVRPTRSVSGSASVESLRKALSDQNDLILEQALQLEELQEAVKTLYNAVSALELRLKEAPAKSKARYHIHGLLARQQQEIMHRFPHLNFTFTEDSVNPFQLDKCTYVFAMTKFMQHSDESNMISRIGDRYVRVSGGISSLINQINEKCKG